jgi:hypothetical protein
MRTRQVSKSQAQPDRKTELPADIPTQISTAASKLVGSTHFPLADFEKVLLAFGDLSEGGQHELATRLIRASGVYRLRISITEQGFPNEHQTWEQLKGISVSAKRLLKLLGITDPKSVAKAVTLADLGSIKFHPVTTTSILTGLYRVAVERRPQIEVDAWDRLKELLVLLSDLVAITAHVEDAPKKPKGKGAKGELIDELIEIYDELRRRFPDSGPKPGFGGPLIRFIRACLQFAISTVVVTGSNGAKHQLDQWAVGPKVSPDRIVDVGDVSDGAIRGAFNRWAERAQIKTEK